jgi:hypothetical protein
MFIRLGYDIEFEIPAPVAIVAMLSVHPSRSADLRAPDEMGIEPAVPLTNYNDGFGNRCTRFLAPQGALRLSNTTLIEDSGRPDLVSPNAREHPVDELPNETLIYLLNSRYCEVDRLSNIATELFGAIPQGWGRGVSILTDMAVEAENIDEAKAEEARQRAAARLREKLSSEEVASVNAALARSLAQLHVKRRQRG